MQEIKCPKCGEVFQVDESGYAAIVKQVRDKEFSKEIQTRETQFESEKNNAVQLAVLEAKKDFYCGVMDSIAGWMSSSFFAVYGATKAALKIFIESVNVELLKAGTTNQILNVSPGMIVGTGFYAGKTDLEALHDLSNEIIHHLENKEDVFIPKYNEVYKAVLQRYHDDFRKEGAHSYEHKMNRINQQ
jgi:hypothetical protein